jgi:hypothetical protein
MSRQIEEWKLNFHGDKEPSVTFRFTDGGHRLLPHYQKDKHGCSASSYLPLFYNQQQQCKGSWYYHETTQGWWIDQKKEDNMEVDFWTALEAASKDERVRIEPVESSKLARRYVYRVGQLLIYHQCNHSTETATLPVDEYLKTKWRIVQPRLYTGVEALEAYRAGKRVKQKGQALWTVKYGTTNFVATDLLYDNWEIDDGS